MLSHLFKSFCLILFLIIFLVNGSLFASEKIIIQGNKNISSSTIKSLAPNDIQSLKPNVVNNYQKKLYETGFFENIKIEIKNDSLYVSVLENPLINFFYLDGIKKKELNNKVFDLIKIRENTIFQKYIINNDIKNINNFLNNVGYLNNKISTQIIKIENNKVNIFYNIELNEKFKINRIFFIGDKYFKSSTLKDVIYLSEHGWWKFFSSSTTPSESFINYDISNLKKFYLNEGFYDVQINSNTIRLVNNNQVNLTYSINAGKKYYISEVKLIDNSRVLKDENINFIQKKFKVIKDEIYNQSLIKELSNDISKYLSDSNLDLNLDFEVIKNSNEKLILSFFVNEILDKKIIDKIIITGNDITDDFVIRNNLFFSEGDFFNKNKLNDSIAKLKGKNLFEKIDYDLLNLDENRLQLTIKVIEQPTGEISAGAGGGTNGVAISGSLNERNFLGKGISVNSNVNIGTQRAFGSIRYSNPDFKNSGNTLSTSVFVENNDFENTSYENKIIGTSVSLYYEIYDKLYFQPGIAADLDSLSAHSDASALIKKREGDFYTTKLFYNLSKNTKNRDIQATDGYVFGAGQDLSFLSDIPYIKNRIFGSYYNEYIENFVGSIRYRAEAINGFDEDIKYSDRLFVSNNYLRGFANKGIGPKLENDFIGGNYAFYTSVSSTIPNGLPEKWNATTNIFFDVANVWGVDDKSTDDSNQVRSSLGLGFSWVSPLGPISFTYAKPISKANTDDVENFNFNIGSAF